MSRSSGTRSGVQMKLVGARAVMEVRPRRAKMADEEKPRGASFFAPLRLPAPFSGIFGAPPAKAFCFDPVWQGSSRGG